MTTDTEALTYDHIVALALEHGFKLKPQVDGRMALNDYVIDFARAVYDIGHADAKAETADPVAGRTTTPRPDVRGFSGVLMKTNLLVRFRRAFKAHDWTPEQRRHYAHQWAKSVRTLGHKWLALPSSTTK